MDKDIEILLMYLQKEVGTQYKILTIKDIMAQLPQKHFRTETQFLSAVNYLKEENYIQVKYNDNTDICLRVNSKTNAYFEHSRTEVKRAVLKKRQYWWFFLMAMLGAFCGCLLYNIIIKLIF